MVVDLRKKAAKEFSEYWKGKGYEKGESQKFWIDLLQNVYGVSNATHYINFEDQVHLDHTSFIDGYIPSTKVMIEQKSIDKSLTAPIKQSNGLFKTPFEQAKAYTIEMPYSKRPRWIITCNFKEFLIYDMEKPQGEPESILLENLDKEYYRMNFLVDEHAELLKKEMQVSIKAGELVGLLYDELIKQYKNPNDSKSQHSLNVLCVRLVFCLYAEDAGLFRKHNAFHDYFVRFQNDVSGFRKALIEFFKILDTKEEDRDEYDDSGINSFPYVNGGLFSDETIEIPAFNEKIIQLLLSKASEGFDWSDISPTIFGAVFESTLNPETRRSGGMHYTSIENIHKVIDPLFLDDLKEELNEIRKLKQFNAIKKRCEEFQNKLASLRFLDPAAGSGNFLTESYICLRRLENEVIQIKNKGQESQIQFGFDAELNPIKVSIQQFYGIEINDFAVTVAKTALWIAESQMMKETEKIVQLNLDFLPLKSYINIVEGNALRINWVDVLDPRDCNYIMGNPPFAGSSIKSVAEQQKEDKEIVFKNIKSSGKLDYVACWYKKAFDYITDTKIEVAFVSTNSITQGEQVRPLWENLLNNGLYINFAYRTFRWDSEANNKAKVHCVIIGISKVERKNKFIVSEGVKKYVPCINGYLVASPNFYIESRGSNPIGMPKLTQGNKPWDGGGLIVSPQEKKELISKYPQLEDYIKVYWGAREFINNIERYCLWFDGVGPNVYRHIPEIRQRFKIVADTRLSSPTLQVQKQAATPMLFQQIRQPKADYILVPETSSHTRKYIPMGFLKKDIIVSNSVMTAENASLYQFGILQSSVHMVWVSTLCGRMKSDYRYSPALYNNFPWLDLSEEQKSKIEHTAKGILEARSLYPESTLADLYDPLTMPAELVKAHDENDKVVMKAYGFKLSMTEGDIIDELFKLYEKAVSKEV